MNATTAMTTGRVTIDGMLSVTATYDPTDRWNGFLMAPLMTRDEAEKVAAWFNEGAEDGDLMRFGETGVLEYRTQDEAPEFIEPDADGRYDLGLGWVWTEDDEEV